MAGPGHTNNRQHYRRVPIVLTFHPPCMYTAGMHIDDTFDTQGQATPCQTHPEVFTDPAHDPDEDLFWAADDDGKAAIVAAKERAENLALAACSRCPLAAECRDWASKVDVFGVAGGTRNAERNGPTPIDLWAPRPPVAKKPRKPARKATDGTGRVEFERRTARWASMAPATVALYERLANNGEVRKETVIQEMVALVEDDVAEQSAPNRRGYPTAAARRAAGARRYVYNLIRIQTRSGNIIENGAADQATLTLDPETAATWRMWRAEAS